jgi:hypothetical protein
MDSYPAIDFEPLLDICRMKALRIKNLAPGDYDGQRNHG